MALNPISTDDLAAGLTVYYHYPSRSTEPYGPYKVVSLHRDHQGPYALLRHDFTEPKTDVRVYLTDDEDYGPLSFYTVTTE